MGLFRKAIKKRAAKLISEKLNLPKEEIYEVLLTSPLFDVNIFFDYLTKKRAEKKNLPVEIYLKILKETGEYLTYDECCKRYYAKKRDMSYEEYKEFIAFRNDNIGKEGINDENVIDYYHASKLDLSIEDYYAFANRENRLQTRDNFIDSKNAEELGISLDDYLKLKEARKLNLSVREYDDYLTAKIQGFTLDAYYYYNYMRTQKYKKDDYIPVSSNDELLAVKESGLKRILLLENHRDDEYNEKLLPNMSKIVISNGVSSINPQLIKKINQSTLVIPPSIKIIDGKILTALASSNIDEIYVLSDIVVDKKESFDFGNKNLFIRSDILTKFKDSFEKPVHTIFYDERLMSVGVFIDQEARKFVFIPGTAIKDDLSILNDYDVANIEITPCINVINKEAFLNASSIRHFIVEDDIFDQDSIILPSNADFITNKYYSINLEIKGENVSFDDVLEIKEGTSEIVDYEYYSSKYKSVIIPSSVKSIGQYAFANSLIEKIYFKGDLDYKSTSFLNCKVNGLYQDKPFINSCIGIDGSLIDSIDLEGVGIIKKGAFEGFNIKNVEIPSSVKEIESMAFSQAKDLNVVINGDVKLQDNAFGKNVSSIVFNEISKENLVSFIKGSNMNLKSITLPSDIDITTFKNVLSSLKKIENLYIAGTRKPRLNWRGEFNEHINTTLGHIEFPECVTELGEKVFDAFKLEINTIVLPDNIVDLVIKTYSFKDTETKIIGSKEAVSRLRNKINLNYQAVTPSLLDSITINNPDDFYKIPLEKRPLIREVIIGEKIEEVPSHGLAYMSRLEKVVFKGLVKRIGEYGFAYCPRIVNIELSPTIREIGSFAFLGCFSLKNIRGFHSLEVVSEGAFNKCRNLEALVFSTAIRVIENCIMDCDSLKLFVVPSSCDKIDIQFNTRGTAIYLPRYIGKPNLRSILTGVNLPKVHCPHNKDWSFTTYYYGYVTYKLGDFKDAVNKIIEPYGYSVLEVEGKKNIERVVHRETGIRRNSEDNYDYLLENDSEMSRASFSTISKDDRIEDFETEPTTIDDIIEEIDSNKQETTVEEVDRIEAIGSYDVVSSDVAITFDSKSHLITNNVFSIHLNIHSSLSCLYVGFISKEGNSATGLYKVSFTNNVLANVSMSLLPGQKNGKYYFVVAQSNKIENSVVFREEVEIRIAFSLDDDFDL